MVDVIDTFTDVDLRALTDGQIEELEAVGKRSKPGLNKSFVKVNERRYWCEMSRCSWVQIPSEAFIC